MTSGLLIWLAIVVVVSLALLVSQRLRRARPRPGAMNLVAAGAVVSLAAALVLGWARDERRAPSFLHTTITTPEGARVDVSVWDGTATVVAARLGPPPAGQVHRIWFLDASGDRIASLDLEPRVTRVADRPELERTASVELVVEPRPGGD